MRNKLQSVRRSRGLSQTKLSAMTGIAQSDLSAVENGRRLPGAGWRQRIAAAFDLPEAELFSGKAGTAKGEA